MYTTPKFNKKKKMFHTLVYSVRKLAKNIFYLLLITMFQPKEALAIKAVYSTPIDILSLYN